ncbi:MAG: zinc transporter ZupT [Campylobacterales bacterium]
MEGSIFLAFLLTLFAGISTGVGSFIAFFTTKNQDKFLSIGLGFSAGVMIYISFMEILVKSKEGFERVYSTTGAEALMLLCFFIGIALSAIIDKLIPEEINPHELRSESDIEPLKENSHIHLKKLKRTGIFTAIAIAIHNFPEGFATFMSVLEDPKIGIAVAIAVAIHNIPEGIAVSLPIYRATGDRKKAFLYSFGSGLSEPLGALMGYFLLAPLLGDMTLAITFGIVAGIMIYISFDELLPSSRVYGNAHTTILGIVAGMAVMAVSLLIL